MKFLLVLLVFLFPGVAYGAETKRQFELDNRYRQCVCSLFVNQERLASEMGLEVLDETPVYIGVSLRRGSRHVEIHTRKSVRVESPGGPLDLTVLEKITASDDRVLIESKLDQPSKDLQSYSMRMELSRKDRTTDATVKLEIVPAEPVGALLLNLYNRAMLVKIERAVRKACDAPLPEKEE